MMACPGSPGLCFRYRKGAMENSGMNRKFQVKSLLDFPTGLSRYNGFWFFHLEEKCRLAKY
jgi:hypothetical protein